MEIVISSPKVTSERTGYARLSAEITVGGVSKKVWFEVQESYGQYLTFERSDAFVIAMLNQAMRTGCNIVSEAPLTAELAFQLREDLIPSLAKYGRRMSLIQIDSDTDGAALPSFGGVGTGMSCGVDSLHSLFMHGPGQGGDLGLTHLTLFNVGAFSQNGDQLSWQITKARQVAEMVGLPLVETDSNLAVAFPRDHRLMHTYSNMFGVHALRKLWRTYFYGSSGMDYGSFSLKDNELHDASFYELLSLDSFSVPQLKIYSEGATKTKFQKVRDILNYPIAQKYLHVCVADDGPNCGTCAKCRRQLLMLDALGALDKYRDVFDLNQYQRNKSHFLSWLAWNKIHYRDDMLLDEVYHNMKGQIGFSSWLEAITLYPVKSIWDIFSGI